MTPTVCHCYCLVVEVASRLKYRARVVVNIITQRIVQTKGKSEVLPHHATEDVTIDIRIWITDDGLVSLINLAILIDIYEVHIASLEILLGTSLVEIV